MTTNQASSTDLKTQLSLTSLMFFGPFVKYLLHDEQAFELTDEDKKFVNGYIRLGTIHLGIALICIALGILDLFFVFQWLNILFIGFSSALLLSLATGSIAVFANISLSTSLNTSSPSLSTKDLGPKKETLLYYLPFVNIYLWYHMHDFEWDYPILKESLIIWTLFGFICLSNNLGLVSILLIVIIIRIVSLMVIWNILAPWSQKFTTIFHKNIEEIWWYIIGSLVRLVGTLLWSSPSFSETISEHRVRYSYLYDLKKYGSIQRQYIILLGITAYLLSLLPSWSDFGFIVIGTSILWWRYILMALAWKHLPPVPIIHDVFSCVDALFHKKSKPSI